MIEMIDMIPEICASHFFDIMRNQACMQHQKTTSGFWGLDGRPFQQMGDTDWKSSMMALLEPLHQRGFLGVFDSSGPLLGIPQEMMFGFLHPFPSYKLVTTSSITNPSAPHPPTPQASLDLRPRQPRWRRRTMETLRATADLSAARLCGEGRQELRPLRDAGSWRRCWRGDHLGSPGCFS